MNKIRTATVMACLTIIASCAQPPKPLRGEFSSIKPNEYINQPQDHIFIRWTGFVVSVENHKNHSCLNILSKIPDSYAKPSRHNSVSTGRFLACKPQFLDPTQFNKKPVTVIGHTKKVIERTVGEHQLKQPLVDASVIYVW